MILQLPDNCDICSHTYSFSIVMDYALWFIVRDSSVGLQFFITLYDYLAITNCLD